MLGNLNTDNRALFMCGLILVAVWMKSEATATSALNNIAAPGRTEEPQLEERRGKGNHSYI